MKQSNTHVLSDDCLTAREKNLLIAHNVSNCKITLFSSNTENKQKKIYYYIFTTFKRSVQVLHNLNHAWYKKSGRCLPLTHLQSM